MKQNTSLLLCDVSIKDETSGVSKTDTDNIPHTLANSHRSTNVCACLYACSQIYLNPVGHARQQDIPISGEANAICREKPNKIDTLEIGQ